MRATRPERFNDNKKKLLKKENNINIKENITIRNI